MSLKLIGGKKIQSPKSDKTRPTTLMVREAIFNILNKNVENSNWLDLFSGSGAISCEAYNHGAKKIVAVEKDKKIALLCKKNLSSLSDLHSRENDIEVICKDVFTWIKSCKKESLLTNKETKNTIFDYVYIDPPYKNNFIGSLLENLFTSSAINENSLVICEQSKDENIKDNCLWRIKDIRYYGQTKLTFLIKIQHARTSPVLVPSTNK
tara:strand:+ start:404 stop:1030 length:627 start_codon:yes stop_codon:yes gene_type:complete